MLSRLRKDRSFKVKTQKRQGFVHAEAGDVTLVRSMANFLGPQRNETWKPKKLNLSFGLNEDPTDVGINWALMWRNFVGGDDTEPAGASVFAQGGGHEYLWSASQHYRLVGAGTGTMQTLDHVVIDFGEEHVHSNEIGATSLEVLDLIAWSQSTASMIAVGDILIDVEYVQEIFADDLSEYEFDFLWEESF